MIKGKPVTDLESWIDVINQQRKDVMENLTGKQIRDSDAKLVSTIHKYFIDKPRPYVRKLSNHLFQTPQANVVLELLKMKVSLLN